MVFSATILRPLTYARNYANLRPPKKQCSEGIDKALRQIKYNKAIYTEKHERAKKRKFAQAVQRATPLRSRFPFSLMILWRRVLVWARRSRAHLFKTGTRLTTICTLFIAIFMVPGESVNAKKNSFRRAPFCRYAVGRRQTWRLAHCGG